MASVVGALTGGGGGGVNFRAQSADLLNPATVEQANEQYANVQQGLKNQAAFLQALQAQNGLGNQSNVFNQLQGVANGTGPNPAQAMLAQATGNNVAAQNALMAGQRGASANPALLARQAAQTGANINQQAAGQGATLQANQALNALGQMGQLATNQANQQANATNAYSQAAQGAQGQILNQISNQNQAAIGNASQQNAANAQLAAQTAQQQGDILGGLTGALGSAAQFIPGIGSAIKSGANFLGGLGKSPAAGSNMLSGVTAQKTPIPKAMAEGGPVVGPRSKVGQHFSGMRSSLPKAPAMMAEGGKVPAMVSPGEKYLSPKAVDKVAKGADPMEEGETIPGKPKVKGAKNSYANDTVPKTLEEGGIVLPRSVTQSKHPHWAAHKFVSAIMKEQALKGKKK